jgi:hypothetical protein
MSGDVHTPTSAGPDAGAVPPPPFDDGDEAERPEILVGAAFAGGLIAAFILKRLSSDDD